MPELDIATLRLHNQHLLGERLASAQDVVRALGVVQSQDYAGAKWGVAQRMADAHDADLDRLYNAGGILRTHMMRPTWHFVLPEDIRWIQDLTAPRVKAVSAYYDRQLELDATLIVRCNKLITKTLRDGNHRTRTELGGVLETGGIAAKGQRLGHIMMHAELDQVVCSGPLRGKQFTYALLDERAPAAAARERDEALAELASRYFTSHGPATAHDFSWWSGLTVGDAKRAAEMLAPALQQETLNGNKYWFFDGKQPQKQLDPVLHLLPNYDEHVVAYKNHGATIEEKVSSKHQPGDDTLDAHLIVLNGLVIGGWRRSVQKQHVEIRTRLLVRLSKAARAALTDAAGEYSRFLGLPVTVLSG